jgi:hypothetical protein
VANDQRFQVVAEARIELARPEGQRILNPPQTVEVIEIIGNAGGPDRPPKAPENPIRDESSRYCYWRAAVLLALALPACAPLADRACAEFAVHLPAPSTSPGHAAELD